MSMSIFYPKTREASPTGWVARVRISTRVPSVDEGRISVKGGVKLDHWGGVKVDQYSMVEDQGLSGRRASGAEACAACKAARLGRSGRRPPPRGVFAARVAGRS